MLNRKYGNRSLVAVWIRLGHSNTKLFHSYTKIEQSANVIKVLVIDVGTRCKA